MTIVAITCSYLLSNLVSSPPPGPHLLSFLCLSTTMASSTNTNTGGAAPPQAQAPDVSLESILHLVDASDDEGEAPPARSVSLTDRGEAPRAKHGLDPDKEGQPIRNSADIKSEHNNDGAAPAGAASTAVVKRERQAPMKRSRSSGSLGGSPDAKTAKGCEKPPAPCEGCGRIKGVSPDFLKRDEFCVWGRDTGDGRWCRECFNCHRTNYDAMFLQDLAA